MVLTKKKLNFTMMMVMKNMTQKTIRAVLTKEVILKLDLSLEDGQNLKKAKCHENCGNLNNF